MDIVALIMSYDYQYLNADFNINIESETYRKTTKKY